jgi:3-isopropylmalate/(R)-2-methylmalate dehydratase small subunit
MKAIKSITGTVVPMNMSDIDTDIIIPAQYLTSTSQTGYGQHAFARLKIDPDFVLNQAQYKQAEILLTGANFGCGSSREHAVWAIRELGIKAIIAPSFADIFSNNAKKNGLLLIQQKQSFIDELFKLCLDENLKISINIEDQSLQARQLNTVFEIDTFFKHCLINGLDELDYLMSHIDKINSFKQQQVNNSLFIKEPLT